MATSREHLTPEVKALCKCGKEFVLGEFYKFTHRGDISWRWTLLFRCRTCAETRDAKIREFNQDRQKQGNRRGGQRKSAMKVSASRSNGRLGGRPRKPIHGADWVIQNPSRRPTLSSVLVQGVSRG
jgi:hypothetical protein